MANIHHYKAILGDINLEQTGNVLVMLHYNISGL